jgi:site-specific DNA recombinase
MAAVAEPATTARLSTSRSHGQALVYCRVSTGKQKEEGTSLDSQADACVLHVETLGYTVGRVTKEVYSGAELWDRPLLARDRADLKAGQFQALVAYSTDRLSRDPIHLAIIADECARAGVELFFVTEPLDSTPEGQLIQYVKGYGAKMERAKFRERTLRGKHTRLLLGKLHSHAAELYGYRRDKEAGVRVIYDPEAHVVRLIFTWVANEGLSIRAVARRLNDQGIPPPSAGKLTYADPDRTPRWGKNQVDRILHNSAYSGETVAWRWARDPKRRGPVARAASEHVRLGEGITPAIVSPDLCERAHAALTSNHGETTRNAARPYLLRGHVWCAVCGHRMQSNVENHRTRIYRCSSRDKACGACGGKRTPADDVEAWVWERVVEVLQHPEIIAAELERRNAEGPDPILQQDLDTAHRQVERCDRAQARWLQEYSDTDAIGDDEAKLWQLVERETKRLEAEKARWQATISELEQRIAQQQAATMQLEGVYAFCAQAADDDLHDADFDKRRKFLTALAVRVSANGREWAISGNIPIPVAESAQRIGAVSHNMNTLCPPLAATSSARLTCS